MQSRLGPRYPSLLSPPSNAGPRICARKWIGPNPKLNRLHRRRLLSGRTDERCIFLEPAGTGNASMHLINDHSVDGKKKLERNEQTKKTWYYSLLRWGKDSRALARKSY
ncbi:hypothetical protein AA313_de0209263 [Arthrobotrys entomopaga]|nr:hypothetical protein AA313_de0209263 [Arthrobotrys entomopaga]